MGLCTSNALPGNTNDEYIDSAYAIAGSTNNWNGVCNGGLMSAALALAGVERYADDIKTYVGKGIQAVERGMWVYAPDGGYEEGPAYWAYGSTYVHVMISCLDSACGTNYGLFNAPGFERSVYFTTYIGIANRTWGFHDGGSGSGDTSIAAWFAKKSNDPNVNAIRRQAQDNGWKGVSMYDIMYFDPHIMTTNISLELDAFYSLDNVMTFRSSWDVGGSIFTGLHGGDNAASHGDLDIGNFIIIVDGTDMICDLGAEAYNVAGYFGCYRWSYYRKRAEGQNTLVMLPTGESWAGSLGVPALKAGSESGNTTAGTNIPEPDQISGAVSEVLRYETGDSSSLAVVDMACAYKYMNDGMRGLYFTDNRSTVVIQDEATFTEAMDIWWFAHTQGVITISDDGRSAIIYYNGVYLYAEIVTDNMTADVKFSAMAADPLDPDYYDVLDENGNVIKDGTKYDGNPDYYTGDVEVSRAKYRKLCVTAENVTSLRLAVVFKVIDGPAVDPEIGTTYTWKDIDEWTVE